jgi:hypothetical protein
MLFHVYLRIDAHCEIEADSPEQADERATAHMEKEIALAVDSPPTVEVVDVCDSEYQSIEY